MLGEDEATKLSVVIPRSILMVSVSPELAQRCRAAARRARVLFCHECTLPSLISLAVERRPLAIVFPEPIYAFDADEFDALARDIQASIVTLPPDLTEQSLDEALEEALSRAELLRHPEPASGRYTVIASSARRRAD